MSYRTKAVFDPSFTFQSGQAFRWARQFGEQSGWIGVAQGKLIAVRKNCFELLSSVDESGNFEKFVRQYFSLDDSLQKIHTTFPRNRYLESALLQYSGLRLLRQDPFECLISFVCSINKNIPAIKACIEQMARKFGERIPAKLGGEFFAFPTPEKLGKATKSDLMSCGVGFRWKYIKFIASKVHEGELDLRILNGESYSEGRRFLISKLSGLTYGVGPKVCDCSLLYSYHKLEAFPIDVWIARCLKQHFLKPMFSDKQEPWTGSLTPASYERLSKRAREYFGKYAGYAQLYLYAKMRSEATRSRSTA
jgi:N-glycosylase/DNA lyase